MVLRLRWESALIWTASRSKENSLTYCLNFFSEIRERLTYLFLIVIVKLTAFHVKVYTEIVPGAPRKTLQDIIRGRVDFETIIHSDG